MLHRCLLQHTAAAIIIQYLIVKSCPPVELTSKNCGLSTLNVILAFSPMSASVALTVTISKPTSTPCSTCSGGRLGHTGLLSLMSVTVIVSWRRRERDVYRYECMCIYIRKVEYLQSIC